MSVKYKHLTASDWVEYRSIFAASRERLGYGHPGGYAQIESRRIVAWVRAGNEYPFWGKQHLTLDERLERFVDRVGAKTAHKMCMAIAAEYADHAKQMEKAKWA